MSDIVVTAEAERTTSSRKITDLTGSTHKSKRDLLLASAEVDRSAGLFAHCHTSLSIDQADQHGRDAYRAGQPLASNPYPADSDQRVAWSEGWHSEDIKGAGRSAPQERTAHPARS